MAHGTIKQGFETPFAETCLDAAETLRVAGFSPSEGCLLGVYPFVTGNPFQRMLYSRGLENGVACLRLTSPHMLDFAPKGIRLIAHYHWLQQTFYGLSSSADAMAAAKDLVSLMQRQKDAGVKLVWTVHNKLSHNAQFPEEELWLRRAVAELADVIHTMNPASREICADLYELPSKKVMHVPHPSYLGVYGAYETKLAARLSLGLEPDAVVFLLFGSLGPHKGTRQILAELDKLQQLVKGKAQLLLAGKHGAPDFMEDVYRLSAGRNDVSMHLGHVNDQDVQTFFTAADAVVCPYPQGLNSGVINTALTFGKPVVAPTELMQSIGDFEAALFDYQAGDMQACLEACANAANDGPAIDLSCYRRWSEAHASHTISDRFFEALKERL